MAYAIIVTGGKQYKVAEGDTIFVEKLDAEAGEKVTFDQVVLTDSKIGTPLLKVLRLLVLSKSKVSKRRLLLLSIKPRRTCILSKATANHIHA